jgi:acyl-CoA reductase-like NAD-dependent aldehyde dehydrogenase
MTGSDKTYESVVFGAGPEGQKRKLEHKPINTKPFTGELGNVTPVIVVPGPWTQQDINQYGTQIATWLAANAGFVCCAPRVIIQQESWPQRSDLSTAIRNQLDSYPPRNAYYPGAFNIHQDFLTAHPEALQLGHPKDGDLPWTIIPDLDPSCTEDICFKREAFGGISSEVSLKADSVGGFLDAAVSFVNQTLWGTLSAILIVHPQSLKQPEVAEAIERSLTRLRYGTVSINMLPFYATYFMVCPWGALPGHDIYDIQSGKGKNFNFLMIDHAEKVILKAPFHRLDPLTIQTRRPDIFARKLTAFEAEPSWIKLMALMWAALTA